MLGSINSTTLSYSCTVQVYAIRYRNDTKAELHFNGAALHFYKVLHYQKKLSTVWYMYNIYLWCSSTLIIMHTV